MEEADSEGVAMETLNEVDEEMLDVNVLLNLHEKRIADLESEVAEWRRNDAQIQGNDDNIPLSTANVGPSSPSSSGNQNTTGSFNGNILRLGTADLGSKPTAGSPHSFPVFRGSVAKTDPSPIRPLRMVNFTAGGFTAGGDARSEPSQSSPRRRLPRRQEVSKVARLGRPLTGCSGIGKDTVRILQTDPYLHVLDATYPELQFEVETLEAKLHYRRHKDDMPMQFPRSTTSTPRREGTLTVPRSIEIGRDTTLGSLYKQRSNNLCQHELSSESSSVEEAQVAILREKIYALQTELAEYGSDDSDVDENFY